MVVKLGAVNAGNFFTSSSAQGKFCCMDLVEC